jgi:hypothetical protein
LETPGWRICGDPPFTAFMFDRCVEKLGRRAVTNGENCDRRQNSILVPKSGRSLAGRQRRHDHIRRNTTLRLFACISVITGAENPADCAIAATASRSRRPPPLLLLGPIKFAERALSMATLPGSGTRHNAGWFGRRLGTVMDRWRAPRPPSWRTRLLGFSSPTHRLS